MHPDGEPDRFISEYTGYVHGEGDDGTARRVGKVHAYRIHADLAARHGIRWKLSTFPGGS